MTFVSLFAFRGESDENVKNIHRGEKGYYRMNVEESKMYNYINLFLNLN